MKNKPFFLLIIMLVASTIANAQDWDREKYPDYNPNYSNPDPALIKYAEIVRRTPKTSKMKRVRALSAAAGLPDHVNNANTKYFPPVFNQAGGSCGSASRICYMFTHELNSYRDIDSGTNETNYPSHFVWLLTYGNSGKDAFVTHVGVPTSATYGGRTYSRIYGNYDWDSEVFGWMQGYDKWFSAFGNRMQKPTTNPYSLGTEEGRLAAKAWLYNHAGDESFKAGGLIGLGVASGGKWERIPKTAVNDNIGVTNMYYVKQWGTSVDHALTMVGYDDRIEFDIDGNGVCGEEDKDEVGAWIIVNSWGGWCNDGFIYCPYAHAGPAFTSEGKLNGWWTGELYHTRKDYRPLRTIKLKMDYTRRSEMKLQVGVSADLNATKPESIIDMHHFRYAGDGHSGETNPAPETPMLGQWADGKMHSEPMEFGYDLTDLTSNYDCSQPLKYFFIINTRSWGLGEGHIYEASIMDYEHDTEGVETPFDLGETGQVEVKSAGTQTVISTIVYGSALNVPQNVAIADGQLSWTAPMLSGHTLEGYVLYHDGKRLTTVGKDVLSHSVEGEGNFGVAALYERGMESKIVSASTAVSKQEENQVINFKHGGFSIPDIFNSSYDECTIEYYIKPNSYINYNNMFGPDWGTFLAHCNQDGTMSVGWNTGADRIGASSKKLSVGLWMHVAIVVKNNKMTLYMGNASVGSVTSSNFSGLGGFGNLEFRNGGSNYQDASYDEIRIWNRARTATEIKNSYNREYYGDVMPEGLMAYYKGDLIQKDGLWYMRDCVGGHHALLTNLNYTQEVPSRQPTLYRPKDAENVLSIDEPSEAIYAGIPTTLTTTRGDGIRSLVWSVPALNIADWHITSPTLTFPQPGQYEVSVTGYDYEADGTDGVAREITATRTIMVEASPAIDTQFTTTATSVASGDRISFSVTHPIAGYAYQWSMPGADVESAGTLTAGATYQCAGEYEITLTVTAPSGETASRSIKVEVSEVAPEADFAINEPVILKGESVHLTSLSKHNPTDLQWTLAGTVQKTIVNGGQNFDLTFEEPGIYNVTLKATNAKGSNSKTQERAVIVTNADSKNGLTFTQSASQVTLSKPLFEEETTTVLTIDWWMNPSKLSSYCLGIGESTSTFMLRTDASGTMFFHNGVKNVNSGKDFVIAGQWHHYVVMYNKGTVKFYRDGRQFASVTGGGSTLARPSAFSIGTSSAPMIGSIDEFRVWRCSTTQTIIQGLCNQPIEDYEEYISGSHANYHLLLYYQFNQTGGDVQDITSNGNTGIRLGFGPDGDAWDLSKGVFCLNFGQKQDDVIIDGIETVDNGYLAVDNGKQGVFDLSGRRLGNGKLKPGLYIIDGKKRLIK